MGQSRTQFGFFFGRDQATIYRWETGALTPDPGSAAALVRLWNDVYGRFGTQDKRETSSFNAFVSGLIAGGLFMYLISLGREDEDE